MARPERNRTARSFRQLRRFDHAINSDKVFGTHIQMGRPMSELGPTRTSACRKVCFAPVNGHRSPRTPCLKRATTGLMHRNKGPRYSITSSAVAASFLHTGNSISVPAVRGQSDLFCPFLSLGDFLTFDAASAGYKGKCRAKKNIRIDLAPYLRATIEHSRQLCAMGEKSRSNRSGIANGSSTINSAPYSVADVIAHW
jgi:hypothetical protein